MKVTRRQLKRIIREEKRRLIEQPISGEQANQMEQSQGAQSERARGWPGAQGKSVGLYKRMYMEKLVNHLVEAAAVATEIAEFGGKFPEAFEGSEANELASYLEDVWEAFGGENDELFKGNPQVGGVHHRMKENK